MTTTTAEQNGTTSAADDVFALLEAATQPVVHPGVARYCSQQLAYFAANNRNSRTLTMADALITVLLANRPADLAKPAEEHPVLAAKEFAYQVKTYATEHGFNCYPRRKGATVTFRFTKPSDDDATETEESSDDASA